MEEKLKQIEEKLDILIAALSTHPDYEKCVKEGLLNIQIEKLKKEIAEKHSTWFSKVRQFMINDIHNNSISYKCRTIRYGTMDAISPKPNVQESIHELIIEFMNEAEKISWNTREFEFDNFVNRIINEDGLCPAYKNRIKECYGDEPNLEEEIEKLKKENPL